MAGRTIYKEIMVKKRTAKDTLRGLEIVIFLSDGVSPARAGDGLYYICFLNSFFG